MMSNVWFLAFCGFTSILQARAVASLDDEFHVTALPNTYMHTGLFNVWNTSTNLPTYAVAVTTEADIQETVQFAARYNLRLVVKSTGHDWYGRSAAAGSLMIWTHLRKKITFAASWTPSGNNGSAGVAAVTVESGVQFSDLYPWAMQNGHLVIGGTCDSVGVGGCWLGGCYGTWSKLYGSSASNLLQAKVVLANGTLVVTNKESYPELFWSIRGGGGGVAGVVTEFTARSHRSPESVLLPGGHFTAVDAAAFQELLVEVVKYQKRVMAPMWGGGIGFKRSPLPATSGYEASLWPKGFEVTRADVDALFQPLMEFVQRPANKGRMSGSISYSHWNASSWKSLGGTLPWEEMHPDREISTALVESMSKYPTLAMMDTADDMARVAAGWVKLCDQMYDIDPYGHQVFSIDNEKGQAGASPVAISLFDETSQNPIIKDATGILLIMYNVPNIPSLDLNSSVALGYLWPRLKRYIIISANDSLISPCEAGVAGDDAMAAECVRLIHTERIPRIRAQLKVVNQTLQEYYPNVVTRPTQIVDDVRRDNPSHVSGTTKMTEIPYSGSYYNECDYQDGDWRRSTWGDTTYAKLLQVKQDYDPTGLFVCHHCVGSELWTADGNCRMPQ